jgi:hypothetical protein
VDYNPKQTPPKLKLKWNKLKVEHRATGVARANMLRVLGAREATPGHGAGPQGRGAAGTRGRRGGGTGVGGARRERKGRVGKNKGEGKRERERERGGELTLGSKSGDHCLQNLGYHGERERGGREREVGAREN